MKPLRSPSRKTPEQLAHELEERLTLDALRAHRWRQRRGIYRIVTLLVGMLLPSLGLTFAGMISNEGFATWIERASWWPSLSTAVGGLAAAAVVFAAGWGVARGMIAFGALFMVVVPVNQVHLGSVVIAMPGLVCLFITTGALVGYLTTMEEGD